MIESCMESLMNAFRNIVKAFEKGIAKLQCIGPFDLIRLK